MRHQGVIQVFIAAMALALLASCAATQHSPSPRLARPGEELAVDYTCRLADDGALAATTLREVAEGKTKKSSIFVPREKFTPIDIRVPEAKEEVVTTPDMSFEETIAKGIAQKIDQAPMGRPFQLKLSHPGYKDLPDRDRYLKIAAEFVDNRRVTIDRQDFAARYPKVTPAAGMTVGGDSDFPALVEKVTDKDVTLYFSAKPGAILPTGTGPATVSEAGDTFRVRLTLKPGDLLRAGPLVGEVRTVGEKTITIDYGNPFGGRSLDCEVTAEPLAEALAKMEQRKKIVSWVEDFDQGLALARKEGKPVVLVLYADWCPFCHRLFEETIPDARLDDVRSAFVWLKVNSDLKPEYGDRFGQKNFPMIVILDKEGKELAKHTGFQDAESMRKELDAVLAGRKAESSGAASLKPLPQTDGKGC